jgi:hypothetical protein
MALLSRHEITQALDSRQNLQSHLGLDSIKHYMRWSKLVTKDSCVALAPHLPRN